MAGSGYINQVPSVHACGAICKEVEGCYYVSYKASAQTCYLKDARANQGIEYNEGWETASVDNCYNSRTGFQCGKVLSVCAILYIIQCKKYLRILNTKMDISPDTILSLLAKLIFQMLLIQLLVNESAKTPMLAKVAAVISHGKKEEIVTLYHRLIGLSMIQTRFLALETVFQEHRTRLRTIKNIFREF